MNEKDEINQAFKEAYAEYCPEVDPIENIDIIGTLLDIFSITEVMFRANNIALTRENLIAFFKGKLSQALDFFDQSFGNAYRALFVEADISQLHRHRNQQFVMTINFLFHLQARPAQVHHLAGNG